MSGCMDLKCYVAPRYHIGWLGCKKKTTDKRLCDTHPGDRIWAGNSEGGGFAATKLPENVESLETVKQLFLFVTIFFLSN